MAGDVGRAIYLAWETFAWWRCYKLSRTSKNNSAVTQKSFKREKFPPDAANRLQFSLSARITHATSGAKVVMGSGRISQLVSNLQILTLKIFNPNNF